MRKVFKFILISNFLLLFATNLYAAVQAPAGAGAGAGAPKFVRGDIGTAQNPPDERFAINDAVQILTVHFLGGDGGDPADPFDQSCRDAMDLDDSGQTNISDPVYLLTYLFLGGPRPAVPGPDVITTIVDPAWCDVDPSNDPGGDLGCSVPPPYCPQQTCTSPCVTSPAEGSLISNAFQIFEWFIPTNVQPLDIYIALATSEEYLNSHGFEGDLWRGEYVGAAARSFNVPVPLNGNPAVFSLAWRDNSGWHANFFHYTTFGIPRVEMVTPSVDSEVSQRFQQFTWRYNGIDTPRTVWVAVGSSPTSFQAGGEGDIWTGEYTDPNASTTFPNVPIPLDGREFWVGVKYQDINTGEWSPTYPFHYIAEDGRVKILEPCGPPACSDPQRDPRTEIRLEQGPGRVIEAPIDGSPNSYEVGLSPIAGQIVSFSLSMSDNPSLPTPLIGGPPLPARMTFSIPCNGTRKTITLRTDFGNGLAINPIIYTAKTTIRGAILTRPQNSCLRVHPINHPQESCQNPPAATETTIDNPATGIYWGGGKNIQMLELSIGSNWGLDDIVDKTTFECLNPGPDVAGCALSPPLNNQDQTIISKLVRGLPLMGTPVHVTLTSIVDDNQEITFEHRFQTENLNFKKGAIRDIGVVSHPDWGLFPVNDALTLGDSPIRFNFNCVGCSGAYQLRVTEPQLNPNIPPAITEYAPGSVNGADSGDSGSYFDENDIEIGPTLINDPTGEDIQDVQLARIRQDGIPVKVSVLSRHNFCDGIMCKPDINPVIHENQDLWFNTYHINTIDRRAQKCFPDAVSCNIQPIYFWVPHVTDTGTVDPKYKIVLSIAGGGTGGGTIQTVEICDKIGRCATDRTGDGFCDVSRNCPFPLNGSQGSCFLSSAQGPVGQGEQSCSFCSSDGNFSDCPNHCFQIFTSDDCNVLPWNANIITRANLNTFKIDLNASPIIQSIDDPNAATPSVTITTVYDGVVNIPFRYTLGANDSGQCNFEPRDITGPAGVPDGVADTCSVSGE